MNEEDVEKEATSYYDHLFKTSELRDLEEILDGIPITITNQMNKELTKKVKEDEIKGAFFSMDPNKGSRSEGMSPLFFQKFWSIIK